MFTRFWLTVVSVVALLGVAAYAEEQQNTPTRPQVINVREAAPKDPETTTPPFRVIILYHQATTPPQTVSQMVEGAQVTIKQKSSTVKENPSAATGRTAAPTPNPNWQNIPIEEFLRGVFGPQLTPAPQANPSENARGIEKKDIRPSPRPVRTLGDLFRASPVQNVGWVTVFNNKESGGGSGGCNFPCFRWWIFCVCIYPDPDPILDILKDLIGLRVSSSTVVIAVGVTPENQETARAVLKRTLADERIWGDSGCVAVGF
ncbi:MAG: hypothetical protein K6U12_10815 [Armatimonadetes bacterium]|nr:hypothetical protein [Armatimonadota bacterium]CUU36415.1 hypothetical protein DCOP10_11730 [Armatimonadetes bacterium DC]